MIEELHLVIDWTNHFKNIDKYIDKTLKIKHIIKMNKLQNKVKTMSEFYNVKVNDFRGETSFTIYIIEDKNPIYDFRKTSKGKRLVNIHLFDLKKYLRKIVGGYKIHGTDNIQETKDNLKALSLFDKYYKQKNFNSLSEVFDELNKYPQLKWMVMRNFEGMPNKITINGHLDVDLLVNDYYLVKRILDGTAVRKQSQQYENGKWSILNYVKINNTNVMFDFRSVGDNYYYKNLQIDMLKTRILNKNSFYIPNPEYHLYTLIYHAIIHKKKIKDDYIDTFKKYGLSKDISNNKKKLKEKLDIFMKKNGYKYVKPEPSVGFFLN